MLTDVYTGLTGEWTAALSPDTYSHIEYTFDGRGNNTKITDSLLQNELYQYDVAGNPVSSVMRNGTEFEYEYSPFGIANETVSKNGVTTAYTYDRNNRLTSETTNGVTLSYVYDVNGNLLNENAVHSFADGTCVTCGEAQSYIMGDASGDGLVKLVDYLRILKYANGDAFANTYSADVTLLVCDIDGDGIIEQADAILVQNYVLNGTSEYPIGTSIANTTSCVAKTYTYNARGQQTGYTDGFTTASYAYNPSGLRSTKTVNGNVKNFIYNGSFIVYEYDDTSNVTYYYGINRTHNSNGEIYVYNAHGDTVQLVKDNAVVVSYTYDAFGNLTEQTGNSDNPFLYCGEYFDSETQSYYLRARYYNPANGRFTQQDAWAFMDTSNPLSLNLYTYCCNNPVMYVDYTGNFGETIKKFFASIFKSIEIELGCGYGLGASTEVAGAEVAVEAYSDIYTLRIDDDEAFMINSGCARIGINYAGQSKLSLGWFFSYLHDYKDRYNPCKEHNSLSSPFSVATCDFADTSCSLSIPIVGSLDADVSEEDIIVGLSGSAHIILGGHFSISINLTEFCNHLICDEEDEQK